MTTKEKLLDRIDELIKSGEEAITLAHGYRPDKSPVAVVPGVEYQQFKAGSLDFLTMVFGSEGEITKNFREPLKPFNQVVAQVQRGIGALIAARRSIEAGFLDSLESFVSGDIFSDFLEMADHLAGESYISPAASLSGAVLEDGLRRICKKNGIAFTTGDGLANLNDKLAKGAIYNKIVHSQVDVWRQIRNDADHGHFGNYTAPQVRQMIDGIREFLARCL
jgi:hypothetical protein